MAYGIHSIHSLSGNSTWETGAKIHHANADVVVRRITER
jgi:hypothetical protein